MSRRLNVFFIHAQWLKDRERVISDFQKLTGKYHFKNIKGVKIRVITDCDPGDINADIIGKTVSYNPIKDEDDTSDLKPSFYNMFMKNLHVFQLSNALKHYKVLEEISRDSAPNDINIVLEDDILYEEKICMTLEKLIDTLLSSYDVIFLGLPSNLDVKNRQEIRFQPTKDVFRVLPYCDSYIVSKDGAKKLYDNYLPIRFVNNVQLSYVLEKTNAESLIGLPNAFMDGSKFGIFLSSLNPNNQLLFNNDYMQTRNLLASDGTNPKEKEYLDKVFKESPLNAHPDFMALKAVHLSKQGNYKEALDLYESTLKIYQSNNCILNHESQFLKDYIKLFKNIQEI